MCIADDRPTCPSHGGGHGPLDGPEARCGNRTDREQSIDLPPRVLLEGTMSENRGKGYETYHRGCIPLVGIAAVGTR